MKIPNMKFFFPGGPRLLPNQQTRDGCIGTVPVEGRRSPAVRVSLKCPVDRDGCLMQATAAPDVSLIETTLAGGTVEREIIRAGPSAEGRTAAVLSAAESTKGWVWGAAGYGPRQTRGVCHSSVPKERLRTNPHTTDRDSHRRCRPGRDNDHPPHTVASTPGGGGRGALPPGPPEIYRDGAKLGEHNRNGTPRAGHPVSDPGP